MPIESCEQLIIIEIYWDRIYFNSILCIASVSEPISIANHSVSLSLSSPIFNAIVSGTDNIIPTGPKIQPQKNNPIKTTNGDNPTPYPSNLGSIKLPNIRLIKKKAIAVVKASPTPNWTNAISTAGTAAMIDPIVGT